MHQISYTTQQGDYERGTLLNYDSHNKRLEGLDLLREANVESSMPADTLGSLWWWYSRSTLHHEDHSRAQIREVIHDQTGKRQLHALEASEGIVSQVLWKIWWQLYSLTSWKFWMTSSVMTSLGAVSRSTRDSPDAAENLLDCATDQASWTDDKVRVDAEVCRVFSKTWRAVIVLGSKEPLTTAGRPAPLGLNAGVVALKTEVILGVQISSLLDPK